MINQRIVQINQQQKSETTQGSGILQRVAVRSVEDVGVQSTDDQEALALSNSAFSKDFSQVPISSTKPQPIMAKLRIGAVRDKYEQEADRVAAQVVQRINAPAVSDQNQAVQRQSEGGMVATPALEASINQARGSGQPVADNIREPMEQAFGADFSGVKIHTGIQSDQLNRSIQARAFTTGQDVFFQQGEYNPGSRRGQELIAHELTHVVQQNKGGNPRISQQQGTGQLIQRYTTERDEQNKCLYNVSKKRLFIVGIDYPNHDLFVKAGTEQGNLNKGLEDGMLNFAVQQSSQVILNDRYDKIYPRYNITPKHQKKQNKEIKKELKENEKKKTNNERKKGKEVEQWYNPIQKDLIVMSNLLETIRKMAVQLTYNYGRNDPAKQQVTEIKRITAKFQLFYSLIDSYLNGESENPKEKCDSFKNYVKNICEHITEEEPKEILKDIHTKSDSLINLLNNKRIIKANSMLRAHRRDQKNTLKSQTNALLLPRGCDLVSGTVLGKATNENNTDAFALNFQLKDGTDKHHFSTKILSDGNDFVTIEGFARASYNVFDNTWEYFLHGNKESEKESFGTYTKRRYQLNNLDTSKAETYKQGPEGNVTKARQSHDWELKKRVRK